MSPASIRDFIRIADISVAYNETAKGRFHQGAENILTALANLLGYSKKGPGGDEYDLRHNQGGIAVSGEITLHSNDIYVQFYQSALAGRFYWRLCNGRKDYTGEENRWESWEVLNDLPTLARKMLDAIEQRRAARVE